MDQTKVTLRSLSGSPSAHAGGNQRRVADAIVEAAGVGARAEQRAIFLRDGDRVADLDAELRDFLGRARAHVDADRLLTMPRPFELRFVPVRRQFHDRVAISRRRVHQRRVSLVEAHLHAAERFHLEAPVVRDRFHLEADFVHVRDDENLRSLRAGSGGADVRDQISGVVRSLRVVPQEGSFRPSSRTGPSCLLAP